MNVWTILGIIICIIFGVFALGIIVLFIYGSLDRVTDLLAKIAHTFIDVRMRWFESKQKALQASIHVIKPDEKGFSGIAYDGEVYHNLDTGEVFRQELGRILTPMQDQMHQMHKLLASTNYRLTQNTIEQLPMPTQEHQTQWPTRLSLQQVTRQYNHRPNIHNLLCGVTVDEYGNQMPVYGDMQEMVHALISGASGWGKSIFMESIAKQLVIGGDCDICAVDYGVNTFGLLQDYFMYPIADSIEMAIALFYKLIEEGRRRKELFRDYPQVKNLDQYNQVTGNNLRHLVVFCDESATLFRNENTKEPTIELAQMSRKFGIGLIFGGTDFKATTVPSEASGNFGARFGFHLMPGLSRSLLHCTDAFKLNQKGRALALLPGQPMVEIQCPIVQNWDDLPPKQEQITLQPIKPKPSDFEQRVKDAWDNLPENDKDNKSALCRALGMKSAGADWNKIMESASRLGLYND